MKRFLLAVAVASLGTASVTRGDDWPQWMGPTRDGIWKETGIVKAFPVAGPMKLWSTPINGGYSGPAVVGKMVYITDFAKAGGGGANNPGAATKADGKERILCLDAMTGKEVWKYEYNCPYAVSYAVGPRCTPTVDNGKLYALGSMGDLVCLNATTGELVWKKDFKADYKAKTPMWGFTGHPLVYQNSLICLVGGEKLLVSFDKDTGKELWQSVETPGDGNAGYCPPSLIEAGGTTQLIVWHPEAIVSVNPVSGSKYWDVKLKPAYGMSIMAPRKSGDILFAGGIGFSCAAIKLAKDKPAAEDVWRGDQKAKNGLYPVNSTPIIDGDIIYGVDQPGYLRAVKLSTGERLWGTKQPVNGQTEDDEKPLNSGTAFLVKNGDRYFLFGETGHLVIANLTPKGYEELGRAKLVEPTQECFGRKVIWSHPAFANKCIFVRNDTEIACFSLAE
jgi:outer membrane protein assembly factor BamB